jgi:poly(hydroxyalkanoate) depolymerase family esterase
MNPVFSRLLIEARQLARKGRLAKAGAALQKAWHDAGPIVRLRERRTLRPARFEAGTFVAGSEARDYQLFVPAGSMHIARPLVVMLHGCGQSSGDFAAGTRMNEHAQALGWLVLYPEQAPRSNRQRCWNWFEPGDQRRGGGEPELIAGMTRHVMTQHRVDPTRVYVAGLSAGGCMAHILAREYPDLYAAVGVHSGVPHGAAHDVGSALAAMQGPGALHPFGAFAFLMPTSAPRPGDGDATTGPPTPVIVFHGDADDTVHPSNGDKVILATLDRIDAAAAVRATTVRVDAGGRRVTRIVHRHTEAEASAPGVAEHWLVHGAGHAWQGGSVEGSYADARGPDASREMLRFFAEHPRAAPRKTSVFAFRRTPRQPAPDVHAPQPATPCRR